MKGNPSDSCPAGLGWRGRAGEAGLLRLRLATGAGLCQVHRDQRKEDNITYKELLRRFNRLLYAP